jgi:tetratricopeptide (TPR) repeat protein
MKRLGILSGALVGLALVADPAAAQRGWAEPQCDLNTSHYLVNSGQLYLKNASSTRFTDQRERDLRDAQRVLRQALDEGRADDGAVWYFLGRFYRMQNDIPGMDSAFRKAMALIPECRADIRSHVRQVWVPILNRGVEALRNNNMEVAKEQFQRANQLYDAEPSGFYYLAQVYAQEGVTDSAIAQYRRATAIANDSTNRNDERFDEIRERSVFNVARLFHREQALDSAAAWYQRALAVDPNDAQALTGLAQVYSDLGQSDRAVAIYDSVLARADSLPLVDLLQAGVALFNGDRFERAARAFETALARNPYFRRRETLFNLANTYLSIGNTDATQKAAMGTKMQPITEQLLEVDPASVAVKRLHAAMYQLRGLPDSTLAILERAQAERFDVTVSSFAPAGGNRWEVRGIINNNTDSSTVTVPELVFEFVDAQGETILTQTVPSQTLEPGGVVPFGLTLEGASIVGWRYRVGTAS